MRIWPSTGGGRGIAFPGLTNSISYVYLDADCTRSPVSLKTGEREGLGGGLWRRRGGGGRGGRGGRGGGRGEERGRESGGKE